MEHLSHETIWFLAWAAETLATPAGSVKQHWSSKHTPRTRGVAQPGVRGEKAPLLLVGGLLLVYEWNIQRVIKLRNQGIKTRYTEKKESEANIQEEVG